MQRVMKYNTIIIMISVIKLKGTRTTALTAVFGTSWFGELARWTGHSWMKQPFVIGVDVQLSRDLLLCYCACEEEHVNKTQLELK